MQKIFENYLFFPITEAKNLKQNIFVSIAIFLLSIFSRSEAYSILYLLDINSFLYFFITNVFGTIFILFIFTIWVGFAVGLFKKNVSIVRFFLGLLNMFSLFFLLLPISLVFFYLDLKPFYFFVETVFSLAILSRILKYTKEFCGFSQKEMFFVVGVPVFFIGLLIFLPIVYIFVLIYGKI